MNIFWRRTTANLIDLLILLPALLLLALLASYLMQIRGWSILAASVLFFILFLFFAFAFYSPLLMRRKKHNGQTLGKQIMKIKIIQESGQPFSYLTALWRQFFIIGLLFFLLSWPLAFLPTIIDLLWALWDRKSQALHDKLATTRATLIH